MAATAGAPSTAAVCERRRSEPGLPVALVGTAGLVAAVWAVAGARLPGMPAFVVLVAALVGCFDLLSVVLLVGRFHDSGQVRSLLLAGAYACPLVMLVGWTAAFPGVWGSRSPLAVTSSTAPWLWVAWHTAFPVLLALALAPSPPRRGQVRRAVPDFRVVAQARRRRLAGAAVAVALVAGGGVVAAVVAAGPRLPVIITGVDSAAMTRLVGPVMVPVVLAAALVAVAGAWRQTGPERWAALAAVATVADVLLTLASRYRYSVGWYAGRTLSIAAAAVVLIAMIAELRRLRQFVDADAAQLRRLLAEESRLERLQATLLEHIADGVVMQDAAGRVVSSNPAARRLLHLSADRLHGRGAMDARWGTLRPDGGDWGAAERPSTVTVRTGQGLAGQIVGVRGGDGHPRWLSVTTSPVIDPASGAVDYVVSSLRDVTTEHAAALAEARLRREREERIRGLLATGGPAIVVQPILHLATGELIGAEALARFPQTPDQSPEVWFADADTAGLGVDLELAAVAAALRLLDHVPPQAYLSINASPATVISPGLRDLLTDAPADRLVLELTEHTAITDYDALAAPLNRLRWSGVRLAIDDAGSGYACLQHILNIAPDIIKLDRALVRDIDTDPARASLTDSLIGFADRIGARLIAEGIETAQERATLQRLGIQYGQGFHLGHPGPAQRLTTLPAPQPTNPLGRHQPRARRDSW